MGHDEIVECLVVTRLRICLELDQRAER
jgi:hypothetical protein